MAQLQLVSNYLELAELEKAGKVIQEIRQQFDRIDRNTQMSVIRVDGVIATIRADLYQAAEIYREGIQIAEADKAQDVPMIGAMYNGLGSLHFLWQEMEQAETYYEQAMVWAQRTGITDILFAAYQGQADLACWRGQAEAALDIMAQFTAYTRRSRLQDIIDMSELIEASYQLRVGRWQTAVRWANASQLKATDTPTFRTREHYKWLIAIRLAESRALGNSDQLPALVTLADRLIAIATTTDFVFDTIEILIWKTLVLDFLGEKTAALTALKTALNLAHKGTLITPFVEKGAPMQALLSQIEDVHPTYVYRLLNTFSQTADSPLPPVSIAASLTEREQEILRYIAAGLSNKAIENKLFISKNTVRTHIKNLYSKLHANGRTQAIARAHELKLL
jgi:LuxR family maltose regulon positive regulatory protein